MTSVTTYGDTFTRNLNAAKLSTKNITVGGAEPVLCLASTQGVEIPECGLTIGQVAAKQDLVVHGNLYAEHIIGCIPEICSANVVIEGVGSNVWYFKVDPVTSNLHLYKNGVSLFDFSE